MNPFWQKSNLSSWDDRAAVHLRSQNKFYDIEGFLAGRDMLYPVEASEIGDVTGKRILHLQCHFGLETLSLARRRAIVTGIDFSPIAINAARELALKSHIQATFVEADIYHTRTAVPGLFDMVYSTWGTICWLPDLQRWAKVIADMLASGGIFYFADSHPSAQVLDEHNSRIEPRYAWRTPPDEPEAFEETASYTGDNHEKPLTLYNWIHPLSDIIMALTEAGLRLVFLHEHEMLPYKLFPSMIAAGNGMFRLPDTAVRFPLSLSLLMVKA